ncbi:MAG: PhoH family protein [Flavobacteriales bacterium]
MSQAKSKENSKADPEKSGSKRKKVYVLDTSVILYDHNAIHSFEENDVAIPITVLEELDNFKKGSDSMNFEAREFIRTLDALSLRSSLQDWIPLDGKDKGNFKVVMNRFLDEVNAEKAFSDEKADHRIIDAARILKKEETDKKVILVTKDVNLRLKARSLELTAEDYETGKVRDAKHLNQGKTLIEDVPQEALDRLNEEGKVPYRELLKERPLDHHFHILRNERTSTLTHFDPEEELLEKVEKRRAAGIMPRNAEQTFALNAILNPSVRLVTVQGVAGTGKTLLALAGSIEQRRDFQQIYLARPIVPLSDKDIGYLPGDISSKIDPFMQPLWDNLKFIKDQFGKEEKQRKQIDELVEKEKLVITALAFIRGRTLSNIIFIVDEAQNLTPHEVRTIITRAGENSKIIFTGDIGQIDSPYLDAESNGLSYLIERLKGSSLYAHIDLEKGERSELAELGNQRL